MNKYQERKVTRTFRRAMSTPADRTTEVKRMPVRAAFVSMFFVMFGGLAGLALFTAPAASAATDTPAVPSCVGINTDIGNGDCVDKIEAESSSSASTEAKVVSINGVDLHSEVTVLANIKANGTPKSQQTNCYTLPRAMSLWTSYNAEGTTGWHWKSYPKGYRFCIINGKVRDPKCHNQVKIGVPKSNPPKNAIKGKVKFVKRLKFTLESVSKVSEAVSAKAKSWCNTANTHAYGEGNGYAAFYAVGRASLSGSVLVKVEAAVNAASQGDLAANLAAQGIVDIKAKAKTVAFGEAVVKASSKAQCQETPLPVTYQAPTASGAAKACVNPGESTGIITASGHNPNNVAAPGTLTVGGQTKQFASVGAGQTVTWDFSGFAPGTYNGSFSLGAPINKSATFTVTVNACVRQPGSIVEVTDINDVRYGSTRTWRIRGMVPEGQSAVLKVSARIGTVKESDKSIALASGAFDLTITYTAPTEGSTDTLTAMLFGSNGVKDDEKSDTFNLLPNPVDP